MRGASEPAPTRRQHDDPRVFNQVAADGPLRASGALAPRTPARAPADNVTHGDGPPYYTSASGGGGGCGDGTAGGGAGGGTSYYTPTSGGGGGTAAGNAADDGGGTPYYTPTGTPTGDFLASTTPWTPPASGGGAPYYTPASSGVAAGGAPTPGGGAHPWESSCAPQRQTMAGRDDPTHAQGGCGGSAGIGAAAGWKWRQTGGRALSHGPLLHYYTTAARDDFTHAQGGEAAPPLPG